MNNSKTSLTFMPNNKTVNIKSNHTVLDAAFYSDIHIESVCGGRGICKSCVIQYQSDNAPLPSKDDQLFFSTKKLNNGWRRACQSTPLENATIKIPKRTGAKSSRLNDSINDIWVPPQSNIMSIAVSLEKPSLEDSRSDAQRLIFAVNNLLIDKKQLLCKTIDFQLLKILPVILRQFNWKFQVAIRGTEIISVQALESPLLGLAIDLGTTNIAILVIDLISGNTLASTGIENPQKKFGSDVITRISLAKNNPDVLHQMQITLITAINKTTEELCKSMGIDKSSIMDIVVAGNTAMHHLFLGLSIDYLGVSPFVATINELSDIKAQLIGIDVAVGANLHMMNNIAGFVGGDHTAALLGIRADEEERTVIVLDIGTNTEISLIHKKKIYSLSSPSGPALEGGNISHGMRAAEGAIEKVSVLNGQIAVATIGNKEPVGICGSAVLDIVSEFYKNQTINFRGQLDNTSQHVIAYKDNYALQLTKGKSALLFTQEDIRNVQLAKGAIRAGIDLLLEQTSLVANDLDKIVIAGAFGSYIRIESAIEIGMLPNLPINYFEQIGNAVTIGAKLALVSIPLREKAKELSTISQHLEQAGSKHFMKRFMKQIHLSKG